MPGFTWRSIALLAFLVVVSMHANAAALEEKQVKAGFIYNFLKFVRWPEHSLESSLTLCTIGNDSLGSTLDKLQNRKINNLTLDVQRGISVSAAQKCQMVYIETVDNSLDSALAALAHKPVLTIGNTSEFTKKGGTIGFVKQGNKIRFTINETAAKQAKLEISSKLLRLGVQ